MQLIQGLNNVDTMLRMYGVVYTGDEVTIRDQKVRNVHNMALIFDPSQPVITSFDARKFNLDYAKREWLWYLGADRFDSSIEQYATMWKKLKQPDGSYYSNYGQYIFATRDDRRLSQFRYVCETLLMDRNSRRASMVLLQPDHLFHENVDTVCTYAINFTIERNCLNMTVMMRSNDVVFGFTNDAFCFWNLYMMVHAWLSERIAGLGIGTYTHFTNSMHVYERHFDMLREIIGTAERGHTPISVPWPTYDDVDTIVDSRGKVLTGDYGAWLAVE